MEAITSTMTKVMETTIYWFANFLLNWLEWKATKEEEQHHEVTTGAHYEGLMHPWTTDWISSFYLEKHLEKVDFFSQTMEFADRRRKPKWQQYNDRELVLMFPIGIK